MTLNLQKSPEQISVTVKSSSSKTVKAWESWIYECGLVTTKQSDLSDVVLWIVPSEKDLSVTDISSRKLVCVGDNNVKAMCKKEKISFISAEDLDSEEIFNSIIQIAEQRSITPPSNDLNDTLLVPIPSKTKLTKPEFDKTASGNTKRITLSRKNLRYQKKDSSNARETREPKNEFEENEPKKQFKNPRKSANKGVSENASNSDFIDFDEGKTILLGFSSGSNENRTMQTLIETATKGEYRIGAIAKSWKEMQLLLKQGEYDVVLVYKKMAGLEDNLIDNMRAIRKALVSRGDLSTRVILFEKQSQSDDYSIAAKGNLDGARIEWKTIHKLNALPECLMSNLEIEEDPFVIEEKQEEVSIKISQALVHKPLLIAAHSSGGGVGKSTSATQLAFYFRNKGYKTLLLELDQDKPSIARCTGIPKHTAGLTGWTKEDFKTEDSALLAIRRTSAYKKGLTVLPVSPITSSRQLLPFNDYTSGEVNNMMGTLLRAAQKEYQIVIADTNPILDDAAVVTILNQADVILFLMEATYIFLDSACGYLDISRQLYIDKKTKYVINKYSKNDPVPIKEIEETLETEVIQVVPVDVDGYRHAADKAKPYKPKKGNSPWDDLAENILKSCQITVVMNEGKQSFLNKFFGKRKKR